LETTTLILQREIIERQKVQNTLVEEKQQSEVILSHVADAIMLTDVEGHILYVNPAWEKITGYALEEVEGKNPRILQSGKTPKSTYEDLWPTIMRGGTWTGMFFNERKNEGVYDALSTISPVKNASGEIIHFVEVQRDITQERQLAAMKE